MIEVALHSGTYVDKDDVAKCFFGIQFMVHAFVRYFRCAVNSHLQT